MGLIRKSVKPILTRYYLLSSKWLGIKLHRIKQSDPEFHTHPWWGISLIFGQYWEQYDEGDVGLKRRLFFNLISPWRAHRVLVTKPVWTLFIHGPRVNEKWRYGKQEAPWRGPDKPLVARTDPTGVFIKGKSGFQKIAEFEFIPPFTIRSTDSYSVEGNEYFVRDEHGNLLQSGKVILKS